MSKGRVLITGASSGIGAALAVQFANNDYDLIITARHGLALEQVRDEIESDVEIDIITCDLALREGPANLIDAIRHKNIQIDILVNNAGVATTGKFEEFDQEDIDGLLALNISAVTHLTRHFLTLMLQRGTGRILNVASVAAFQPVPSMGIYAASKAFVLSLTESLSEELRGTGVSVTALCPGLTSTPSVDTQEVPPFLISSAPDVAREGFEALMAREVIRIPGMANQTAVTWAQHQPRWLVRGLGGLFSRLTHRG